MTQSWLVMLAATTVTACGPATSPESAVVPSQSTSTRAAASIRELTDAAARDVVAGLNTLGPNQTCRLTGSPRPGGRDLGYTLDWNLLTVSETTFSKKVILETTSRSDWNNDLSMTVVVPDDLRGRSVTFEAHYDGIEVITRNGPRPDGYAKPSAWPALLSQVVTKIDYDIACAGPTGNTKLTRSIGVWDGLRFAAYPDDGTPAIIIKETPLR